MEATTNLIGGQPFSLANLQAVQQLAARHGIPVVLDCSLISENAYFIKCREEDYRDTSIADIVKEMMSLADLIYLSGRKSTCVRGGLMATNNDGVLQTTQGLAAGLRRVHHLRRHVEQRDRGHGRRLAGDGRLRRGQQFGGSDQVLRREDGGRGEFPP